MIDNIREGMISMSKRLRDRVYELNEPVDAEEVYGGTDDYKYLVISTYASNGTIALYVNPLPTTNYLSRSIVLSTNHSYVKDNHPNNDEFYSINHNYFSNSGAWILDNLIKQGVVVKGDKSIESGFNTYELYSVVFDNLTEVVDEDTVSSDDMYVGQ